jgi:hypothetical protein
MLFLFLKNQLASKYLINKRFINVRFSDKSANGRNVVKADILAMSALSDLETSALYCAGGGFLLKAAAGKRCYYVVLRIYEQE